MEEELYTGWVKWEPTDDEWSQFFETKQTPFKLLENEYLIIHLKNESPLYYCYENGQFRQFRGGAIKTFKDEEETPILEDVGGKKSSRSKQKYSKGKHVIISARNEEQTCAFDLIKDESKPIKLITGTWGTGKTMIMVTAALEALRDGRFEQIVWIRNNVDVKDTKDLGALPGEVLNKLLPFLGPFIDHAGENAVKIMIQKESLKVEPLQSLRGRNFENTLIMCSEAENLTKEHIQLIVARAAEGSEVWFDGDNKQRDKAAFEKSQGIETMIDRFKGNKLFGYVKLIKSERSATAAMADLLD